MKNYKTTIAFIIGAIIVAAETIQPFLESGQDLNWYNIALAVVVAVGGYLAKDHDKDNNEDVSTMNDPIGGGGVKKPGDE